ncbi:MAG: hypothetical protein L7U87_01285 [Chlamydiales bacterium]|nr:hypothetical protein [Chlamydiales bacterium]
MTDLPGVPPQPGESPINPNTDFHTTGGDQGISSDPTIDTSTIKEADIQEFQGAMNDTAVQSPVNEAQVNNVMDLSRTTSTQAGGPPQDIDASFQSIQSNFDQVKTHLDFFEKNSQLSIPPDKDRSVKGSIRDFSETFNSVGKDLEGGPELSSPPSIGSPLKDFLGYFTGAQDKMNELTSTLNNQKGEMSTTDLLKVQHKMNKMQQQVEFSTTTINKLVEFLKQMQNIQL